MSNEQHPTPREDERSSNAPTVPANDRPSVRHTETKTYTDGTVATGIAPLPAISPAQGEQPAVDRVMGLVDDYGQWMWDAGYFDSPTGETLVDDATDRRVEIREAVDAAQREAYAEGRKDEAEEHAWRPIESAPEDELILVATTGDYVDTAHWTNDGDGVRWWWSAGTQRLHQNLKPTHWMPLPTHPAPAIAAGSAA